MEDLAQFLAIPENRAAVLEISRRVLAERDPDSTEIAAGFIEPLIEMAAQGEFTVGDDSDQEGGFGAIDVMTMLVVPAVAGALGNILAKWVEKNIEWLKKRSKREKKTPQVNVDEIEAKLHSLIPPSHKKEIKQKEIKKLAKIIHAAILTNLEN